MFRGLKDAVTVLKCSFLAAIVNAVLDIVFVFGEGILGDRLELERPLFRVWLVSFGCRFGNCAFGVLQLWCHVPEAPF